MEKINVMHLMITAKCHNKCKFCCNTFYDLNKIDIATEGELNSVNTLCITGGEPLLFSAKSINDFVTKIKSRYKNIKNVYIYTTGYKLYNFLSNLDLDTQIDGITLSPKTKQDWKDIAIAANIKYLNGFEKVQILLNKFSNKSNQLYVFPEGQKMLDQYKYIVNKLHVKVIDRQWKKEADSKSDEIFRRLNTNFN